MSVYLHLVPKKNMRNVIIANPMTVSQLPNLSFRSNAYFGKFGVGFDQHRTKPLFQTFWNRKIHDQDKKGSKTKAYLLKPEIRLGISYARSLNTEFYCLYSYKRTGNNAYNECYFKWLNSTHCQTFRTNTPMSVRSTVLIYQMGHFKPT